MTKQLINPNFSGSNVPIGFQNNQGITQNYAPIPQSGPNNAPQFVNYTDAEGSYTEPNPAYGRSNPNINNLYGYKPGADQIFNLTGIDPVSQTRQDGLANIADQLYSSAPQPFPGSQVAPFNPDQQRVFEQLRGLQNSDLYQGIQQGGVAATGAIPGVANYLNSPELQGLSNDAIAANRKFLNPSFMDVGNNPYIQDYLRTANDEVTRNYTESILPQVYGNNIQNGNFGGSRDLNVGRVQVLDQLNEDIGRFSYETLAGQYNQNQQAQIDAMGLAPGTARIIPDAALQGSQAIKNFSDVGTDALRAELDVLNAQYQGGFAQQSLDQAYVDDNVAKYYESQYGPYWAFDSYASVISGLDSGVLNLSNSPEFTGTQGASTAANVIGGALSGAAAGAATGAAVGAAGGPFGAGVGAAGGAIIGGVGALLSSNAANSGDDEEERRRRAEAARLARQNG